VGHPPSHEDLRRKLAALERKYDAKFKVVFDAIGELMDARKKPTKGQIGFRRDQRGGARAGWVPYRWWQQGVETSSAGRLMLSGGGTCEG